MEKETLEKLVKEGLSIREIGREVGKAPSTVRHWLKKYELKTIKKTLIVDGRKLCPKCDETKPVEEFYTRNGNIGGSGYCKLCMNEQTAIRQRVLKSNTIAYKGGECQCCGYDKYQGALEFHHLNPDEKDFSISHVKLKKFDDTIKKELDKCILVCANCHREIHGGLIDVSHFQGELKK